MQQRKLTYQILALATVAGIIISFLLGPGTVAPELTAYSLLGGLVLFFSEYLWLRETVLTSGQPITTKWVVTTLTILVMSVIPQAICLVLAAFLWFAVLPLLVISTAIFLYMLINSQKQKDLRKKRS